MTIEGHNDPPAELFVPAYEYEAVSPSQRREAAPFPEPPSWMIEGFYAAAEEPAIKDALWSMGVDDIGWLISALPDNERTDAFVQTCLKDIAAKGGLTWYFLEYIRPGRWTEAVLDFLIREISPQRTLDENSREIAVQALRKFPWGDRGDMITSVLLRTIDPSQEPSQNVRNAARFVLASQPAGRSTKTIVSDLLRHEKAPSARVDSLVYLPLSARTEAVYDAFRQANDLGVRSLSPDDRARSVDRARLRSILNSLPHNPKTILDLAYLPFGPWDQDVVEFLNAGDLSKVSSAVRLRFMPPGPTLDAALSDFLSHRENIVIAEYMKRFPPGERSRSIVSAVLDDVEESKVCRFEEADLIGWLEYLPLDGVENRALKVLLAELNKPESSCRMSAVKALSNPYITDREDAIGPLLAQIDQEPEGGGDTYGGLVIDTLGVLPLGSRRGEFVDGVFRNLDRSVSQHVASIESLGRQGTSGEEIYPSFVKLRSTELLGELKSLRMLARADRPAKTTEILGLLENYADLDKSGKHTMRAFALILSGGPRENLESATLLQLLMNPSVAIAPRHQDVVILDKYWTSLPESLRADASIAVRAYVESKCNGIDELGGLSRVLVRGFFREECLTTEEKATLTSLAEKLGDVSPVGRIITVKLAHNGSPLWGVIVVECVAAWIVFCALFLFAFPWSRQVQAVFLYSPYVRRFLSLGVVPLLLLLIPWLRRRLLVPFRHDMVAAANLGRLDEEKFFHGSRVRIGGTDSPTTVLDALNSSRGVVVLRGHSGLGKSYALRLFVKNAAEAVVFLHARECRLGVIEAIAAMIKNVQDLEFIRGMIHTGTLIVVIDGLNEVSAATCETIAAFVRLNMRARILIGTQPLELSLPTGVTEIELLPLDRDNGAAFLRSRRQDADYQEAVDKFLNNVPSDEAVQILANPFDLDLAADLLTKGRTPKLRDLIAQAFQLADEKYHQVYHYHLPLEVLGRLAVDMRMADQNIIEPTKLANASNVLLEYRLLVSRVVPGDGNKTEVGGREILLFRHDRVWEFFVTAAFAKDEELMLKCFDDRRFSGAFLRIADTWPPEQAMIVQAALVDRAAEKNENTTSNEFVRRLKIRQLVRSGVNPAPRG